MGTTSGPELLLALDRTAARPLRAQLEDGLRDAVRSGRLPAAGRLPASRALAADLGISRRLVVDAYAQLLAEGYLTARPGAGTFVAGTPAVAAAPRPARPVDPPAFDFFPGYPDLAGFPRRAWLRVLRETLRDAPDRAFGYPDPRGALELRVALGGHLGRVRGVVADPESIVITSGSAQAFGLLAATLAGAPMAVEDPGLLAHRAILEAHGASLVGLTVDAQGARVTALDSIGAGRCGSVLLTPAHQAPMGVVLTSARRAAVLAWAGAGERVVIEDDYDAEFRYDRAPLGAMQGLAPDRVIYSGTVSKTLAPALRLGWLVLPPRLIGPLIERKLKADHGSPTIDQLALARLLESGAYDRHLRQARRRYRARRDALVAAVEAHLPGARVTGLAAGLHALVRVGRTFEAHDLMRAAARESLGVYPLGLSYMQPRAVEDGLVLGYANLAEPAIEEGIRRLARALMAAGPAPTKDGGAMAR